jgi:hypothetical protein
MMFNNEAKVAAVMNLFEQRSTVPCQSILILLDICTQEMREVNDYAAEEELKLNQGEIRAYRKLKGFIERGFPVKATNPVEKAY